MSIEETYVSSERGYLKSQYGLSQLAARVGAGAAQHGVRTLERRADVREHG